LLKDVRAKPAQSVHAVANIDFGNFLETLLLPIRHHGERHVERVFLLQPRRVLDRVQFAGDAHDGEDADFEMKVGGAMTGGNSQQVVNFHGHYWD
jgi:hypothetical protein